MKYYTYDEQTKEFLFSGECEIDTLETKRQGENVYLLPANSTFEEPLKSKEGFAIVYNDGWKYIVDYRGKKYIKDNTVKEVKELGDFKILTDEQLKKINSGDLIIENNKLKEKPLEELKEEKREEINAAREEARKTEGAEYDGDIFDVDETSQSNILAQIKVAELLKDTEATYIYRSKTNTDHLLNVTELQELGLSIAQKVNAIYAKSWELKAKVDSATTAEEVEAIKWILE